MSRADFAADVLQLLRDYASPGAVEQGLELLDAPAVELVSVQETLEERQYLFLVHSLPPHRSVQHVSVYREQNGEVSSHCDCPQAICGHEVAAILYLDQNGAFSIQVPSGEQRAQPPAWRTTLDAILPPIRDTGDTAETEEVCLFLTFDSGTLRIRPGERGKTGWIKGKAKWETLYTLECSDRVRALLKKLYDAWLNLGMMSRYRYGWSPSYGIDWLPLGNLPLPDLWDVLHELRDSGVELVEWEGRRPVALAAEPARVRIAAHLDADRELILQPELRFGQAPTAPGTDATHVFLGEPAVVIAEVTPTEARGHDIRLRRFAEPVADELLELLRRQEPLRVGPQDREDFENRYLPRLRRLVPVESPDSSYEPPEPKPAVLELELTPVTTDKGELDRLHLRWVWRREPLGEVDREHESAVRSAVEDVGLTVVDQALPRDRAVPFLTDTVPRLESLDHVCVTRTEEVPAFRRATADPRVEIGVSTEGRDWFDLRVEVTVGGEKVSFAELFTALSRGQEIFVLPSGTYFDLDTPEFDQLRRIIEEARTLNDTTVEDLKVSRYQVDLWEELVENGVVDAQEHDWWFRIRALAQSFEHTNAGSLGVPDSLHAELRDYQKAGFRWLETLRRNRLGGVLADDMGLGKTLQILAMITAAVEEDADAPPFLVIAPTSVVGNWIREARKFAPHLAALAITETEKKRGLPLAEMVTGAGIQVVVTSYTLFRLEFDDYAALNWSAVVFDEAQMIKNHNSRAYRNARLLDVPVKIAVTGTPMENNLLELWALVSLTSPGLLGGKTHFTEFFRTPIEKDNDAERLELLQRRLRPFLLRRTKELVAADLPEKVENVLELDLYPKHRRLYDRRLQRERQKVLGLVDDLDANRFEIFRSLTLLRQLALDAELAGEDGAPSAKLDALADLLSSSATEGHRVLVLSQFTRFLAKARDVAIAAGIESLYLDGKTRNRQDVIDEFREGEAAVFFISLKAGGFGLNLTEADYVVLLDPWWNPATEAQAVDRAHRIGQTRQVIVYRLVARNTIESKVMELKNSKAALFDRVLEGGGTVEADGLGAEDIRALME